MSPANSLAQLWKENKVRPPTTASASMSSGPATMSLSSGSDGNFAHYPDSFFNEHLETLTAAHKQDVESALAEARQHPAKAARTLEAVRGFTESSLAVPREGFSVEDGLESINFAAWTVLQLAELEVLLEEILRQKDNNESEKII